MTMRSVHLWARSMSLVMSLWHLTGVRLMTVPFLPVKAEWRRWSHSERFLLETNVEASNIEKHRRVLSWKWNQRKRKRGHGSRIFSSPTLFFLWLALHAVFAFDKQDTFKSLNICLRLYLGFLTHDEYKAHVRSLTTYFRCMFNVEHHFLTPLR